MKEPPKITRLRLDPIVPLFRTGQPARLVDRLPHPARVKIPVRRWRCQSWTPPIRPAR